MNKLSRQLTTLLSLILLSLPAPVLIHTLTEALLGSPQQRLANRVGATTRVSKTAFERVQVAGVGSRERR